MRSAPAPRSHMRVLPPFQLLWLSLAFLLAGCDKDDPTAQLCEQSGGEWREVSDCPSACEPPPPTAEACATIEDTVCAAVCGEVPMCSCPNDKPFWQDARGQDGTGCVGFDACPDSDTAE